MILGGCAMPKVKILDIFSIPMKFRTTPGQRAMVPNQFFGEISRWLEKRELGGVYIRFEAGFGESVGVDVDAKLPASRDKEKNISTGRTTDPESSLFLPPSSSRSGLRPKPARLAGSLARNELDWEISLEQCLRILKKTKSDIEGERKSAQWKFALALVLKERTSAPNGWNPGKLNMGGHNSFSHNVSLFRPEQK